MRKLDSVEFLERWIYKDRFDRRFHHFSVELFKNICFFVSESLNLTLGVDFCDDEGVFAPRELYKTELG